MKVGLQIYSVRNRMAEDPVGTLQKVSDMGYKYIETYSHPEGRDEKTFGFGLPVKEAKARLDDLGLKVVGAHFYPEHPEGLDEYCAYYAELGADQVGCGGIYETEMAHKAANLNAAGKVAKKHGLRYYYHNHYHEYRKVNGEYIMHIYAKETDPELVAFELDTFWLARAGLNPVEEIKYYGNRLVLLHQKDFTKGLDEPISVFGEGRIDRCEPITPEIMDKYRRQDVYAEVGTGILPIQDYIDAGNEVGCPYILLEQDFTTMDEIDSIQTSMDAFRKFKGIEWD
ncbi:sugar phosphate isomerase/epimerase family protein [Gehongia tenuis]|uniref:Sugar phosphate isomerase/epimerase n=1 Tax=Gehongia tenuis TaxID=2763655 RepID=A0A926HNZ7_9FIRM|nr:TIM barrel protein [Gehongia tenuis]MBC8530688.1 sugar phosphate isomerase/epimerase [Gehongia tenuis]